MPDYTDRYFRQRANPQGFAVDPLIDRSTGVECIRGCGNIVVYNGNYFCECGWAAPEYTYCSPPQKKFLDKLIMGLDNA